MGMDNKYIFQCVLLVITWSLMIACTATPYATTSGSTTVTIGLWKYTIGSTETDIDPGTDYYYCDALASTNETARGFSVLCILFIFFSFVLKIIQTANSSDSGVVNDAEQTETLHWIFTIFTVWNTFCALVTWASVFALFDRAWCNGTSLSSSSSYTVGASGFLGLFAFFLLVVILVAEWLKWNDDRSTIEKNEAERAAKAKEDAEKKQIDDAAAAAVAAAATTGDPNNAPNTVTVAVGGTNASEVPPPTFGNVQAVAPPTFD